MIFSLQRRFVLLLLLPVALILVLVGVAGFFYAREYLLQQWRDIARLELEKTAHVITMRLDEKLELINLIAKSENIPDHYITQAYLIQQLAQKPGVLFVDIETGKPESKGSQQSSSTEAQAESDLGEGLYVMEVCEEFGFCAPTADPFALDRTLRIIKPIEDENTGATKKLLVRISFDAFMEPIRRMVHAEGSSACLVTSTGQLLAHTDKSMSSKRMLGDTGDPLEKRVSQRNPPQVIWHCLWTGAPARRCRWFLQNSISKLVHNPLFERFRGVAAHNRIPVLLRYCRYGGLTSYSDPYSRNDPICGHLRQ